VVQLRLAQEEIADFGARISRVGTGPMVREVVIGKRRYAETMMRQGPSLRI